MKNLNFFVTSRRITEMNMKRCLYILIMCTLTTHLWAQTVPSAAPVAEYVTKEDGSTKTVNAGENFSEEAPLHIECYGKMSNVGTTTVYYEWKLSKVVSGSESLLIRRDTEDTSFDVYDTGTYSLRFAYSYQQGGVTVDVDDIDPITFTVPESSLTCPDGISPNGDDKNDYLFVTCKSIVKLNAVLFNRWGKKIASCDMAQALAHEKSSGNKLCIWDGYIGGRVAKDGVYFINLVAEGSDGVVYKIKKAINVLKGYTSDQETDGNSN